MTVSPSLDAVLFDMDGVVTDTAAAHAAAWKRLFDEFLAARATRTGEPFEPFDASRDYRAHVDGMPRFDGVRSFLAARGIDLPEGSPDDGPDAQTVFGLGNQKQRHFREWLAENVVRVYPGTRALIDALHRQGVRTALFTSSRNAEAVLENAGIGDLFEVKVDGRDLAELGLEGKPSPGMLLEAAARLGAAPEVTAIVEDAVSGVEAGRRGGFALVVGVARNGHEAELTEAGADLVVGDLAELGVQQRRLAAKTLVTLPSVWDSAEEIRTRLAGRKPVVFLDYDGTLSPIVADHRKAIMSDDMRGTVAALSRTSHVTIVSGRDLEMLRRLVALDTVYLAGSHGFEIAVPDGSVDTVEKGVEFLPLLDEVEDTLRRRLSAIAGHSVERKRFSVAVHYRQVADAQVDRLAQLVEEVVVDYPSLARGYGKKVFEIQPGIDWNKGRAVDWLLERLGHDEGRSLPIYVGDDITDEHAFRSLSGRGLTVVVRDGDEARRTAADYAVADTDEVRRLLEMLRQLAEGAMEISA